MKYESIDLTGLNDSNMAEVLNQWYPEELSYQPQQTAPWESFFHNMTDGSNECDSTIFSNQSNPPRNTQTSIKRPVPLKHYEKWDNCTAFEGGSHNISVQQPSTSTSYMNQNGNNQQPAYSPRQNGSKSSDCRPEIVYYQPPPNSLGQMPSSSFDFMSEIMNYQHPAYTFGHEPSTSNDCVFENEDYQLSANPIGPIPNLIPIHNQGNNTSMYNNTQGSISKTSTNQNQGSPFANVKYLQGEIRTSTPNDYGNPTTIMDNLQGFSQSSNQSYSSSATIENYFLGLTPSPIHSNSSPTTMVNDLQGLTFPNHSYENATGKVIDPYEVIPKTVSDYKPENKEEWIPKTVINYGPVTKDSKKTKGRPKNSSKSSGILSVSPPESSPGTGSEVSIDDILRSCQSHSSTSVGRPDLSIIPNAEDMITIQPSAIEQPCKKQRVKKHSTRKRRCPLCPFRSHHPMEVIVHIVDNHSKVDRSKQCPFCIQEFSKDFLLERHIHNVHKNNMCSDCQFIPGSIGLLKCYYHAERTSPILVCPFCKYSATGRLEMTAHIIVKHTSRCTECYFKHPIEYFLYSNETYHKGSTAKKKNSKNKIQQKTIPSETT